MRDRLRYTQYGRIANPTELDANGKSADTRTPAQKHTMIALLRSLKADYPDAEIPGHCDLSGVKKTCPNFDVRTEYAHLAPL